MSMKTVRAGITIPKFVMDYLDELAEELGSTRSGAIGEAVLYVSQHEDDFMAQFDLTEEEEEDEEEDLEEE